MVDMKELLVLLILGLSYNVATGHGRLEYKCFSGQYMETKESVNLPVNNTLPWIVPGEIYKLDIIAGGIHTYHGICDHRITVYGSSGTFRVATGAVLNLRAGKETLFFKGDTIGNLQYIKVKLPTCILRTKWYPRRLTVENFQRNRHAYFTCKNASSSDGKRKRRSISRAMEIRVHTGGVIMGGTKAPVYMKIRGSKSYSRELRLYGDFNRYNVATTSVSVGDIGRVKGIRLRRGDYNFSPNWFVDKVEIKEHGVATYKFDCYTWIEKYEKTFDITSETAEIQTSIRTSSLSTVKFFTPTSALAQPTQPSLATTTTTATSSVSATNFTQGDQHGLEVSSTVNPIVVIQKCTQVHIIVSSFLAGALATVIIGAICYIIRRKVLKYKKRKTQMGLKNSTKIRNTNNYLAPISEDPYTHINNSDVYVLQHEYTSINRLTKATTHPQDNQSQL